MSIHIITDSASDIAQNAYDNVTVLPMTVTFGEEERKDGVTITHKEFYERLIESSTLPVTSQISPFQFEEAMRPLVEEGKQVLVITMSGKLSGTNQSAMIAANAFPEKVAVVDSENVTIGEHVLVDVARRVIEDGLSMDEIVEKLNLAKKKIRLVALLDTLEYLMKGGRISKTAAFAGGLLSIKPVIAVVDGEISVLGKARGSKQANNLIAQEIEKNGGVDFEEPYYFGYTGNSDALLQKYIEDNKALWEGKTERFPITTVGGTIGTHVGPGAIAVAWIVP